MNDFFEPARVWALLKVLWQRHQRWLYMYATLAFAVPLAYLLFLGKINPLDKGIDTIDNAIALFATVTVIAWIHFSLLFSADFKDTSAKVLFLQLPASTFEKWLSISVSILWLLPMVLYIAGRAAIELGIALTGHGTYEKFDRIAYILSFISKDFSTEGLISSISILFILFFATRGPVKGLVFGIGAFALLVIAGHYVNSIIAPWIHGQGRASLNFAFVYEHLDLMNYGRRIYLDRTWGLYAFFKLITLVFPLAIYYFRLKELEA